MPDRRVSIVPVLLTTVIAGWLASCADATEPDHKVRITATTPTSLTGTVGAEVQPAPSVRATDENDRPLSGVVITFKVATGGGTASAGPVITGADGSATVGNWTLGPTMGTQTMTAGAGGRADVVFTAAVSVAIVEQLTVLAGDNQMAGVDRVLEQQLVVRAADAFGEPVAGTSVVFTVTAGGGSIDAGRVLTDFSGTAATQWRLGAEPGVQTVSVVAGVAVLGFRAFAVAPPGELEGQIAFTSRGGGPSLNLGIVNADGSSRAELLVGFRPRWPVWSPDGSLIALTSDAPDADDEPYGLGIMTADGENVTWWRELLFVGDFAWSPDGAAILFSTPEGPKSLSLADGRVAPLPGMTGSDGQASWSPDGQKLVFVSSRGGGADIYVANADGSAQTPLTDADAGPEPVRQFSHPRWSPDGSMIAFLYGDDVAKGGTEFRVAVMAADGTFLKDLASAGAAPVGPESLAWSPDGSGVAFTFYSCDPNGPPDCISIRYVSLDGSLQFTIAEKAMSPTWRR